MLEEQSMLSTVYAYSTILVVVCLSQQAQQAVHVIGDWSGYKTFATSELLPSWPIKAMMMVQEAHKSQFQPFLGCAAAALVLADKKNNMNVGS